MTLPVRISEIGLYLRCPRLVYFESLGSWIGESDPSRMLLRSLMLTLSCLQPPPSSTDLHSCIQSSADLKNYLQENLARLEQEMPLVYEIDAAELQAACRDLEKEIGGISQGLASYLDLIHPSEVEVDLYSRKLGLSGRLDRLVEGGVPSIIRTGKAPSEGVWKRDRIILSGYALLLGEKMMKHVDRGVVEYSRQGLVRKVEIHGVDRARVLRIRDRVRQIKEGRLPDRPEDAPCQGCRAANICQTRHSLASKFF